MKSLFLLLLSVVVYGSITAQQCLSDGSMAFPAPPPPASHGPATQYSYPVSRSGSHYKIPFDTILFNPILGAKGAFNIVICEDGVTNDADIAAADNYVDSIILRWQSVAHYSHRFNYFNVYRVAKYSEQQGATNGYGKGDTLVHNRYGSTFDAYGLSRLVIPENIDTFFADVTEHVPNYDLAINLVYDKNYGGSGWDLYDGRKVASFGIDQATGWNLGDEVITHEMQHIMPFAGHSYLGDEYEDNTYCAIYDTIPISYKDCPNFTSDTVNGRKWQDWINEGIPGVGFYDSAGICAGNFRPTELCAMRSVFIIINDNNFLGMPPFCPVCQENSTAYFDSVINPIYYSSPSPTTYTGTYTFSVKVDTPRINTFRYQWLLDDSLIALGVDTVNINFSSIPVTSNHTLRFVCTDVDPVILDTTLRRPWITTWQLATDSVALGIAAINQNEFHLFPNPVTSQLNGTIQQLSPNTFIEIFTPDGRIAMSSIPVTQNSFSIPVANLPQGIYFVEIQNKAQKIVERIVKE